MTYSGQFTLECLSQSDGKPYVYYVLHLSQPTQVYFAAGWSEVGVTLRVRDSQSGSVLFGFEANASVGDAATFSSQLPAGGYSFVVNATDSERAPFTVSFSATGSRDQATANRNTDTPRVTNSTRRTNGDLGSGRVRVQSRLPESNEPGFFTYFGEPVPSDIRHFGSERTAEAVVDAILETAGLTSRTFTTRAANVPNAAAQIRRGGERLLLYNSTFIADTERRTGTRWAGISVMAHEIAHHLQGHTLTDGGSTPPTELEADNWSGFILRQMGASLADAQAVMDLIGSEGGSRTHPAKRQRLRAIEEGWRRAGSRSGSGAPTDRDPEEVRARRACERDGGVWVDGWCEEPVPEFDLGFACYTPFGACPLRTGLPMSDPCWCPGGVVGRVGR